MDIKELAKLSISEVKEASEKLSRIKGVSLKSVSGLISVVKEICKHVENVGLSAGIKGADKQALAIELICMVSPLPAWIMYFVRPILPALVDAIVDALKDNFGKK